MRKKYIPTEDLIKSICDALVNEKPIIGKLQENHIDTDFLRGIIIAIKYKDILNKYECRIIEKGVCTVSTKITDDLLEIIAELMEDPRITNGEIAKVSGIKYNTIHSFRTGRRKKIFIDRYNIVTPISHKSYRSPKDTNEVIKILADAKDKINKLPNKGIRP